MRAASGISFREDRGCKEERINLLGLLSRRHGNTEQHNQERRHRRWLGEDAANVTGQGEEEGPGRGRIKVGREGR